MGEHRWSIDPEPRVNLYRIDLCTSNHKNKQIVPVKVAPTEPHHNMIAIDHITARLQCEQGHELSECQARLSSMARLNELSRARNRYLWTEKDLTFSIQYPWAGPTLDTGPGPLFLI